MNPRTLALCPLESLATPMVITLVDGDGICKMSC